MQARVPNLWKQNHYTSTYTWCWWCLTSLNCDHKIFGMIVCNCSGGGILPSIEIVELSLHSNAARAGTHETTREGYQIKFEYRFNQVRVHVNQPHWQKTITSVTYWLLDTTFWNVHIPKHQMLLVDELFCVFYPSTSLIWVVSCFNWSDLIYSEANKYRFLARRLQIRSNQVMFQT